MGIVAEETWKKAFAKIDEIATSKDERLGKLQALLHARGGDDRAWQSAALELAVAETQLDRATLELSGLVKDLRSLKKERATILFLAANAVENVHLALDEEIRAIGGALEKTPGWDKITLVSRWAVRPPDILQAVNELQPVVIHFSGHGTPKGELIFEGKEGSQFPVKAHAMVKAITAACPDTRFCYFNACFSDADAAAVVTRLEAAVGMRTAISDAAALAFARQFYSAVGFGKSLAVAMAEARAILEIEGIEEEDTPVLHLRPGTDAASIALIPE
jgi:hypothetical protein